MVKQRENDRFQSPGKRRGRQLFPDLLIKAPLKVANAAGSIIYPQAESASYKKQNTFAKGHCEPRIERLIVRGAAKVVR
jgi:hypothetical protein